MLIHRGRHPAPAAGVTARLNTARVLMLFSLSQQLLPTHLPTDLLTATIGALSDQPEQGA